MVGRGRCTRRQARSLRRGLNDVRIREGEGEVGELTQELGSKEADRVGEEVGRELSRARLYPDSCGGVGLYHLIREVRIHVLGAGALDIRPKNVGRCYISRGFIFR